MVIMIQEPRTWHNAVTFTCKLDANHHILSQT